MHKCGTYQDCRIIRDILGRLLFWLFVLNDFDVFDVAASEDDELELLLRRRNEFLDGALLSTERQDVLESYCRFFGIDLVKGANIAMSLRISKRCRDCTGGTYRISLFEMSENR